MGRLISKPIGDLEIAGYSLAGEETVVALPQYNVCFDVGRAPREIIPIDNVCLTHGHMDHAAGIAYYFSQRLFVGTKPGRIICHRRLVDPITRLMEVWQEIEGHESPGEVVGLEHLQDLTLRRNLLVRAFHVNHSSSSLGFALIEQRHKLRPEFHDRTGPQLVELKKQGVSIEVTQEVPLVAFPGDTALGPFLDLPFVREAAIVLMECTFFDADHRSRARAGRHMHVDDMPAVYEALPSPQIVITHITRRTDLRLAKRLLLDRLSVDDAARTTFLMERPPRPKRPNRPREENQTPDATS
jgi:ribonuclease Z